MIVLDTNVVSELLKSRPDVSVARWFERSTGRETYLTATVAAELLSGVELMPAGRRRDELATATEFALEEHNGRILPFDSFAARPFALTIATRARQGRTMSFPDAQIAAVCLAHGATLATRNTRDFEGTGIDLVNPWDA